MTMAWRRCCEPVAAGILEGVITREVDLRIYNVIGYAIIAGYAATCMYFAPPAIGQGLVFVHSNDGRVSGPFEGAPVLIVASATPHLMAMKLTPQTTMTASAKATSRVDIGIMILPFVAWAGQDIRNRRKANDWW